MSDSEITGRNLRNRVVYAIKGHLGIFHYGHCSRCRKFTGSAFAANPRVAPADFRWIAGAEFVGLFISLGYPATRRKTAPVWTRRSVVWPGCRCSTAFSNPTTGN
jgi:hypothetical protein